ncbi:MAG: hypothetical protein AAF669_02475 [Pseudomonadota bacterium]
MMQNADTLITYAHLLSMQGEGVGYITDIKTGKQADLICVDLQMLSLVPTMLEPIRNLVSGDG